MKQRLLVIAAIAVCLPATAEEICRSISTSWDTESGQSFNTRMWTKADDAGCKIVDHLVDGEKIEGVDCNCDLIADGYEDRIPQPVSERQRGRLTDICEGPIAIEEAAPMSKPGDPIIING